jgi:IS30 family transposase
MSFGFPYGTQLSQVRYGASGWRRVWSSHLAYRCRTRRRKPKCSERRGKLCNMTNIKERPEEIEGRLVSGHWEGDIILGSGGASAIGTLGQLVRTAETGVVERCPAKPLTPARCADRS